MLIFFTILLPDIYIEDFYRTLISFDFFSPEDGVKYADVLEYLLSYRPETRFDVIFSVGPLQLSGPGCVFLQVSASSNFTSPEGTVKLSGILGFWRRNRLSVERRINNLGTCQGAD